MPVQPRELAPPARPRAAPAGDPGAAPVCRSCGYSLRGLPQGGRCPECGAALSRSIRRSARFADNLTDAPVGYLRRLGLGLTLLAVGLPAALVGLVVARASGSLAGAAVAGLGSVVALAGAGVVVLKRPLSERTLPDPLLDSRWLRALALLLPLLLLGAAGVEGYALHLASLGQFEILTVIQGPMRAVMVLTAFLAAPLALYLSAFGDWASESGLAERLRISAWGLGLGAPAWGLGVYGAGLFGPVAGLVYWSGLVIAFGVGASVLLLLASIVESVPMAFWAARNAVTAIERDERVAKRQAEREKAMVERTFRVPDPVSPIAPTDRAAQGGRPGGVGPPGPGGREPDPYPLAPD